MLFKFNREEDWDTLTADTLVYFLLGCSMITTIIQVVFMIALIVKYIKSKCPEKQKVTPIEIQNILRNQRTSVVGLEHMNTYNNTEISASQDINTTLPHNLSSNRPDFTSQRDRSGSNINFPE